MSASFLVTGGTQEKLAESILDRDECKGAGQPPPNGCQGYPVELLLEGVTVDAGSPDVDLWRLR